MAGWDSPTFELLRLKSACVGLLLVPMKIGAGRLGSISLVTPNPGPHLRRGGHVEFV